MVSLRSTRATGNRLRKREEFQAVYELGERVPGSLFFLYILENGRSESRLGITASRKVGKNVVRNQIRRRLREIFRVHRDEVPTPCDVVVNVKKAAAEADFGQLEKGFTQAILKWKRNKAG